MELRTSLGRARGLGSAREGVGHWWAQRLSAIALVPLSIWFVFSCIALMGADYATFQQWLAQFGNALLMILTVVVLFHHAVLGMQVVLEDYVHHPFWTVALLVFSRFVLYALAASCVLAVVLVALGA